jgi:cell division protein ZapA
MSETIKVSIFDQTYSLRSVSGDEHVKRIAHIVDERMRLISEQTTTFDLTRIAVLAALNIADELERMRNLPMHEQSSALATFSNDPVSNESAKAEEASTASSVNNNAPNKKADEPQSWFDAIFDAEMPAKNSSERLSSQVSAKLKTLRQEDTKASHNVAEEAEQS